MLLHWGAASLDDFSTALLRLGGQVRAVELQFATEIHCERRQSLSCILGATPSAHAR